MAAMGIKPSQIRAAFVTHLDSDHFRLSWQRALPSGCRIYMHKSHARSAASRRMLKRAITPFSARDDERLDVFPDMTMRAVLASHDDLGVASFRFDFTGSRTGQASLGFATDLGRVPDSIVDINYAVDVMALESNYCPIMQRASGRPVFLKDRIMGGSGHLSNEQSSEAMNSIKPKSTAVLLHLSRECNTPDRAREVHSRDNPPHNIVITSQFEQTPWIDIVSSGATKSKSSEMPQQIPLFG
ncbi:MAG: hypothetical protein H6815_09920 [Phycisphaeraceae bacterium]|nr:hypothetical protein [Phycisphaerales bacterium]MCB9860754.1 hypothetical protein [Phycisphaeraceae bacterium]